METANGTSSSHPSDEQLSDAIKAILSGADLADLSSKKVRRMLEERFSVNLSAQKQHIDKLLMNAVADQTKEESKATTSTSANGVADNGEAESSGSASDSEPDRTRGQIDDEELARQLQNEEMGTRRSRAGASSSRPAKRRKTGGDDEEKPKKKKGKGSMYSRELLLSDELQAVMGKQRMCRSDVVKEMWRIFNERNLKDPANKQFVLLHDQPELFEVFKKKRLKAFGMMKDLSKHLFNPEEIC